MLIEKVTFHRHRGRDDDWQPFCIECDARAHATSDKRWKAFQVAIAKDGTQNLWTRESYFQLMNDAHWSCVYCKCSVHDWDQGTGHCVDRISSKGLHTPNNAQVCCWPCNKFKSDMTEIWFRTFIDFVLSKYRPGTVPWDDISPRNKRRAFPDLNQYIADDGQLLLVKP